MTNERKVRKLAAACGAELARVKKSDKYRLMVRVGKTLEQVPFHFLADPERDSGDATLGVWETVLDAERLQTLRVIEEHLRREVLGYFDLVEAEVETVKDFDFGRTNDTDIQWGAATDLAEFMAAWEKAAERLTETVEPAAAAA
jgi:hypothetical protein